MTLVVVTAGVLFAGCSSDAQRTERWKFSEPSGASEVGVDSPPSDAVDGELPIERKLHPRAKFLRAEDPVPKAERFRLREFGLQPGRRIKIIERGDFDYNGGMTTNFVAVFSSDRRILSYDERHRVPGAIDAGEDYETGKTFYSKEPTDIPEDFRVKKDDPVTIAIPSGAAFLMVGNSDPLATDNTDRDDDFAVRIERP